MADKHFGADGVRALWEEALDTFIEDSTYQLDKAELEDRLDAVEQSGYDDTAVKSDIASLQADVAAMPAQIDGKVSKAVSDLVGGAPEAYDTLKEIAEYISADGAAAADLAGRVSVLENAEDEYLTADEIKAICKRVTEEVVLGKYSAATKEDVFNALSKIEGNGTITLEEDIDLGTNRINVPAGKTLTLDLAGKTISADNAANNPLVYVYNGGELEVKGGTLEGTNNVVYAASGGKVTIADATVTSTASNALYATGENTEIVINPGSQVNAQEFGAVAVTNATVTMNGGTITTVDNCGLGGNGIVKEGDDRGHVTINFNGGTINAGITSNGYAACGIYMPNSGVLNVTGGTINAENGCGILMRAGKLNMTGGSINAVDNKTAAGEPSTFKGMVGDSRVVVPCAAIVYDDAANYPGAKNGEFAVAVSGGRLTSATGLKAIEIVSDNPEAAEQKVVDTRPLVED